MPWNALLSLSPGLHSVWSSCRYISTWLATVRSGIVYCLARLVVMLCDKADVVLDSPSATEVVSDAREEPRENPPPPVEPEPELGADAGFLLGVDLGLDLAVPETPDRVRCMATFIIGPLRSLLPTESIRSLVLETAVVAVAVAVFIERPSPPRAPPSPVPIRPKPRGVSVLLLSDPEPDAG